MALAAADTEQVLAAEQVTWRDEVGVGSPARFAAAVRDASADLSRHRADLLMVTDQPRARSPDAVAEPTNPDPPTRTA